MKTILITGCAGFIGSNLIYPLLNKYKIIGLDNINNYYDETLKKSRLKEFENIDDFLFKKCDLVDKEFINSIFEEYNPDIVINLAAQAGVRYSIDNPQAYIDSNIIGFFNILEACRKYPVEHLIYASSSSVYGSNKQVPYSTNDKVDNPVSLYAATKKSNELMAHAYSKLYDIPTTGLRFFTVYGPAGRPDMAYFKFTNKMVKGEKIQIYNHGDMYRDFTYIDDIVDGISKVMTTPPNIDEDGVKYKIYNIGNNKPESLMNFVNILEEKLLKYGIINRKVEKELLPMQPGDVYQTYADISDLQRDFGFSPKTSLNEGLDKFAKWYKEYYMECK